MAYSTPKDVWDWLNDGTEVKNEVVTTSGDGSRTNYDLTNSSIISGSETVLFGADYVTDSSVLTSSQYSLSYPRGHLILTAAGATTVSGSQVMIDYEYSSIDDNKVIQLISGADREVERRTGRVWSSQSTSEFITVTDENNWEYFTRHYPHIAVDSVAENTAGITDTPVWVTRSAGGGNDYLTTDRDKSLGRIRYIDNLPAEGIDKLRINYQYGYATVPQEIKRLSVLFTVKELIMNPVFAKQLLAGRDTFTGLDPVFIDAEINKVIGQLRKHDYRMI